MIHVCLGLYDKTGRYSKFTGTTILSIFENTTAPVTVHILHDDTLTEDNRDKFIYIAGRYGQTVKFYNVEELCADKLNEMVNLVPAVMTSHVGVGTFYRLLIEQIIPPEIDKCIYLDSDIIVNLDINEFWQIALGEKIFAAVPEILSYKTTENMNLIFNLCSHGFVKCEDYFNCGVLVMNLNILREEKETMLGGIKFVNQNPQCGIYLDQDILNYCFSAKVLKLPTKFNRFTRFTRKDEETLTKKIYHYAGGSFGYGLALDMNDPFNRLWMNYFVKTPWFNENIIGRLYESFVQAQTSLNKSAQNLLAKLNGKTRAFIVLNTELDTLFENFFVRQDENIFVFENGVPLQKIVDVMNTSRGEKVFFFLIPNFPFNVAEEAGFVRGKDFFDGFDFLADKFDSYSFVKAM